jgi:putative phosphoesterase
MVVTAMQVGVIADIHSNLPALEAVLADMSTVDMLVCAGDIVGYYLDCNEVCERIRSLNVPVVRGNHDAYVLGALTPAPERRDAYRTDWTRAALAPDNLQWLASLPTERRLDVAGVTLILRHASPWDEETYLYPDSPQLAQMSESEIMLVGHTHYPMVKRAGAGMIVNPGSVGQPRDWSPPAAYAVVSLPSRTVKFCRAAYNVDQLQARLVRSGLPAGSIKILSRTRSQC